MKRFLRGGAEAEVQVRPNARCLDATASAKAVSLFERKSTMRGAQTPVTQWAQQNVPMLQQHLTLARTTAQQVGVTVPQAPTTGERGTLMPRRQQTAQQPPVAPQAAAVASKPVAGSVVAGEGRWLGS